MASAIPPLLVEIELQTSQINAGLAQLTQKIDNFGTHIAGAGEHVSKLKELMLGVFGGNLLTSGLMGVEKTLEEMNLAVQDAQVEQERLVTALKNTGNATEANQAAIEESVKSYANLGFTHAQAAQAMGTLITATGNVAESMNLMTMAADLARYKHIDLNTAATTLARGTQGSVKAFKELGITLDSNLPKNEAIAKAFDQLNAKIGGQASAYTKTFAGEIAVLKEKFNEMALVIGNVVFPIVTKIIDAFSTLINIIKPFAPELLVIAGVIGTVAAAYKAWALITKTVALVQEGYMVTLTLLKGAKLEDVVATDAQTASMKALNFVINQNPFVKLAEVVAIVIGVMVELYQHNMKVRNIMLDVAEAGVKSVAWLIEWFGKLVTAIMDLESGPLKLLLKGLAFLRVPGAKEALNDLNGAIKTVGTFFDNASKSVDGYVTKLEQMKRATSSYGMQTSGGVTGDPTVTGNVPEKTANAKLTATQQALVKISQLETTYRDASAKAYEVFNNTVKDATQKRYEEEAAIAQKYNDDKLALDQNYADKYKAIITQSIDQMRSSFAGATSLNVGTMFSQLLGGVNNTGNITNLIQQFSNKLQGAKVLAEDAGKLHGLGFSQQFIDQVVAQGENTGHLLASAIENSSPETIAQLQDVYTQLDQISNHGVDALATTMNDGIHFANDALAAQYLQTQKDYQTALDKLAETQKTDLAKVAQNYNDTVAKAHDTLALSLETAANALNKALDAIAASAVGKLDAIKKAVADARAIAEGQAAASRSYTSPYAYTAPSTPTTTTPTPSTPITPTNINSGVTAANMAAAINYSTTSAKLTEPDSPAMPTDTGSKYSGITINVNAQTNASASDIASQTAFTIATSMDTVFSRANQRLAL